MVRREKDKQKVQGLTAKQRKARYTEDHEGQAVKERVDEYLMKKTDKAIDMVKYAIKRGVRFDYLLVDSWFTNTNHWCLPPIIIFSYFSNLQLSVTR